MLDYTNPSSSCVRNGSETIEPLSSDNDDTKLDSLNLHVDATPGLCMAQQAIQRR